MHCFKVKLYHTHLFTPFNDTTAQVSTGLWVDHGNLPLYLLVNKEFLTAFCLFPEINASAIRITEAVELPVFSVHIKKNKNLQTRKHIFG